MAKKKTAGSSKRLHSLVRQLIEIESDKKYKEAKKVVKLRSDCRTEVKSCLENEVHLPRGAEVYAGYRTTDGRVSWRGVSEHLAQKYDMEPEELEKEAEKYRNPGKTIKYGPAQDFNHQLTFDFVTPKIFS